VSQVSLPSSDSWDLADAETADLVASCRRMRNQIEREVLPRATFLDGLRFACQASLHDLRLCRGGYVVLETGGRQRLGQVTDLRVDRQAAAVEGLTGHAVPASCWTPTAGSVGTRSCAGSPGRARPTRSGSHPPRRPSSAWTSSATEEYAALSELLRLQKHGEPLITDIAQRRPVDTDLDATPEQGARERGVPVRQPATS